ncbi:alkaline phosphatase family protein [Sphingobacterium sp. UDSM-2020]|uniref:alkaline phosphatase family protein n=1 Tax=Sphingobacterium sp. UDSM-2020 TaxID=2795738 RepID=UPI0019362D87|nr:alkaline phosphatase family protein [Sphingobacterium sp. UDSM-2020]QQD14734.1 alkaline phosphatase family protein [Sphingobacterium sp. UDSM-2020]
MKLNFKIHTALFLILIGVSIIVGCKKYDNPPSVFEEIKDLSTAQRKVLVITIDGLAGAELQKSLPKNIAMMKKNAKYTFNTLATATSTAGWVSMLTGTSLMKHHISDESFERTEDGDNEDHGEIVNYRNVLDYVTQYKTVTTAMVTPSTNLRDYIRNADDSPVVASDLAVKDSSLSILSQNSLGTIFVNFKALQEAGNNGGFDTSNPAFVAALNQTDTYIGNLLDGVKARKNYDQEDWLIIVTTNHGGGKNDSQNGFIMLYNPSFEEYELKKSGFNGVLFAEKTSKAIITDNTGLFDAGETKSFTVQMDVKFNAVPNGYSSFFGHSTNLNGQNITGWQWAYYPGGGWVVTVGGTLNGGVGKSDITADDQPGTDWHTLTMTVNYLDANTRTLKMFVDGKLQSKSMNISRNKSLTTTEALRIGHRAGDNDVPTSFHSANLTYFNTALSEETVKNTFKLTDITKHPNYSNVIGYWPMDEGLEDKFFNKINGGTNIPITGSYRWVSFGDDFPPSSKPDEKVEKYSIISTAYDVSALTLYWMNIPILKDFGFDGIPYLDKFEVEFLKK